MKTYDPQTTLDAISRNAFAVVVIGGLSIVANRKLREPQPRQSLAWSTSHRRCGAEPSARISSRLSCIESHSRSRSLNTSPSAFIAIQHTPQ